MDRPPNEPENIENLIWRLRHNEAAKHLCHAAADNIEAMRAMTDWRSIESAPKDGTVIDLWCIDRDGEGARWADCWWGEVQHTCVDAHCDTCADIPQGRGWLEAISCHHSFIFDQPTHWMPLPSAPAPKSDEGGKP